MSKTIQEKLKKSLRRRLALVILCFVLAVIFAVLAAIFFPGAEALKRYTDNSRTEIAGTGETSGLAAVLKKGRLTGTVSVPVRADEAGIGDEDGIIPDDFCGTGRMDDMLDEVTAKLFIICVSLSAFFFLAGIALFFILKIPAKSAELKAVQAAGAEPKDARTRKTAARSRWPKEAEQTGSAGPVPVSPSGSSPIDSVTAQLGGTTEQVSPPFGNTMELNLQEMFIIEQDIGFLGSDEFIS